MFADHALTQSQFGGAKELATPLGSHVMKPSPKESKWQRFDINSDYSTPTNMKLLSTPNMKPNLVCSTPLSQISTAPGTPCTGRLDDFHLDDLKDDDKSETGPFRLDE